MICRDARTEGLNRNGNNEPRPYLSCVNDAIIKITSATLRMSTAKTCPLQFVNRPNNQNPTCQTNNFANSDVTNELKTL